METFNACVMFEGEHTCAVYGVVSLSCVHFVKDETTIIFACIYQRSVLTREEAGVKYIKILCDNPEAKAETALEDV